LIPRHAKRNRLKNINLPKTYGEMTTTAIRQKLANYLKVADEKK